MTRRTYSAPSIIIPSIIEKTIEADIITGSVGSVLMGSVTDVDERIECEDNEF